MYNCICRNPRTPRTYPIYGTPGRGFGRVSRRTSFTAIRRINITRNMDRSVLGSLETGFRKRYDRINVCLTVTEITSERNCPRISTTFAGCTFRRTRRTTGFTRLLNRILASDAGGGLRVHMSTRANTYRNGFSLTGHTGTRGLSTVRSAIRRVTGSRTERNTNFENLLGECFGWSLGRWGVGGIDLVVM